MYGAAVSTLDDVAAGASRGVAVDAFGSGDVIAGRYRVHRRIADGGMGRVFEGEDLLLGGRLAIKVIRADLATQPRAVERFRREIHLARRIAHPNVCRVYDVALHRTARGELPVLTMELLAGETLAQRIARGRLRVDEVRPIARQLAAALNAAHCAGIVLRDRRTGGRPAGATNGGAAVESSAGPGAGI